SRVSSRGRPMILAVAPAAARFTSYSQIWPELRNGTDSFRRTIDPADPKRNRSVSLISWSWYAASRAPIGTRLGSWLGIGQSVQGSARQAVSARARRRLTTARVRDRRGLATLRSRLLCSKWYRSIV